MVVGRERVHGAGWRGWRRSRRSCLCLLAAGSLACGDRRDAADLAVGVQPFEQLRGMNVTPLRSGMVRAMRASATPAPLEGLRESIGTFDVLYGLTGYDGTDGAWPDEEALVLFIEGTREWPSDSAAAGAWRSAMREIQAGMGTAPTCLVVRGPGFAIRVAEWTHRDGWAVTTTFAAGDSAAVPAQTPRHSIAIRRQAFTATLPGADAEDPDALPTWERTSCTPADTATDASADGAAPKSTSRTTP